VAWTPTERSSWDLRTPAVCSTYMGSVERGETEPKLGSLAMIARTLRITTSKLLEGVD
jgi:hypothetical protein